MHVPLIPPELIGIIREKRHFLILGHKDPDGDCVASQLVTASMLRRIGKTAGCFTEKPFTRPELIRFKNALSLENPATVGAEETAVIAVDCSTNDRISGYSDALLPFPLIMIDHHSSGRPFGSARYIDPEAASTTVMIHRIMTALQMEPTQEEAELLLFGLCTDTGFFRHLETGSGETLSAAASLTDRGASLKKVYGMIFGGRSLDSRIMLGKLLSRTESFFEGKMLFTFLSRDDLQRHGEEAKDSDTLYGLLQGTSGVIVVVLVREEADGTRTVGIRTNHTVDAGSLADQFGGGGHQRAAGFSSSLKVPELREEILKTVSILL